MRAAIRAGDWAEANRLAFGLLGDRWSASYEPAGTVHWRWAPTDATDEYARSLDLSTGIARTEVGAEDGRRTLTSFVDPVCSVAIASTEASEDLSDAQAETPHPVTARRTVSVGDTDIHLIAGRVPDIVVPNYARDDDPVRYSDETPDADGTVAAGMGFVLAWAVQQRGGERRLLTTVTTGYRGWDQRPIADPEQLVDEALERMAGVVDESTETLRDRAVAAHAEYFDRFDLDLSASAQLEPDVAQAELFFHLGRYLLITSSRPGTEASALQGIWNVDVRPGWSANYTTNINTPMNYWGAEATGVPELHEPLFTFLRDVREAGRETARRHYGASGTVLHHNTDIWRMPTPPPITPQYALWPSAFTWLVAHSYDHVDFAAGADEAFLRDTALPLHRDAVAFVLDMLVEDDDGGLVASPATSPEHAFVLADGSQVAVSAGTAMEQELIREVLTHYLELVERGGSADDAELVERAGAALAQLRTPVVVDGVLQEWRHAETPLELGHRHLSHLYGLFPGTRITTRRTPDELEAARAALARRLNNGSGYTGWSQAWVLCLAARLRDHDLADRALRRLTHDLSSESLLDLHPHKDWPGGAIFQIDGNFGAVAGVTELLVQSHDDVIDLLPALPPTWRDGTVRGLRVRGGHAIAQRWTDGRLVSATLTAGRDGTIVVETRAQALSVRKDGVGDIDVRAEAAPEGATRIAWHARAGSRFEIEVMT